MKKIIFLAAVLTLFGTTAATVSAQCDPNVESPIKCGYYNAGYQNGVSDAQSNRSNDYRRYRNQYNRQWESTFRDGYQLGYSSVGGDSGSRWTNSQRSAYDAGYSIGQNDRRRSDRTANLNQRGYDSNIALYFQQGYDDGYSSIPRRYNFPVGQYPTPDPGPPWGGGNSGSATWAGTVDDRGNIVIRGNELYTQNVSGNGVTTTFKNMNGRLPRRPVTVDVRKQAGRGNVSVVQQPSRNNNFTAVVQVYDSRSGRDNYRLSISWSGGGSGNVEEPYSPGRLTWRGRVDQTVDITIAGDYAEARDVAGTGLSVISSNVSGYLAHRPGSVRVSKRNGRGQVTVVQQPSRSNDYTAIIRISDVVSGADNYDLEVTW